VTTSATTMRLARRLVFGAGELEVHGVAGLREKELVRKDGERFAVPRTALSGVLFEGSQPYPLLLRQPEASSASWSSVRPG